MGAPPTLHTFTTSEVVTAANLNLMRDAVNWLFTGKPDCRVHASTTQNLSTATWTNINFNVVDNDSEGGFASNAYTVKVAGFYLISGSLVMVPGANGTAIRFTANGVVGPGITALPNTASPINSGVGIVAAAQLAVNDVIRMQGFQTSGGTLSTAANFTSGAAEASYMHLALLRGT